MSPLGNGHWRTQARHHLLHHSGSVHHQGGWSPEQTQTGGDQRARSVPGSIIYLLLGLLSICSCNTKGSAFVFSLWLNGLLLRGFSSFPSECSCWAVNLPLIQEIIFYSYIVIPLLSQTYSYLENLTEINVNLNIYLCALGIQCLLLRFLFYKYMF